MHDLPDPVDLTRELIRTRSVNPPGEEDVCAHLVGEQLAAAGFDVQYHSFDHGRTSVVASLGHAQAGPPLCLTGHLDTVPLGAQPWSVDPFGGEIRDGRLYGRGASDMKSGVAALVCAALAERARLREGRGVRLVLTAGEETGCEGAMHLRGAGDALGEAAAIIVAEPTANYPLSGHKGAFWAYARASGVTAHGSTPEAGESAIYKVARMIARLAEFRFDTAAHPVMGAPTLNVGTVNGGLNLNSVPDRAEAGIDIRTVPGLDHGELRARLARTLAQDLAELHTVVDLAPVWTEPEDRWMQGVFDVMQRTLGERPQARSANYFTDAAVLAPAYGFVPTVVLGPGEPEQAHRTDEYCLVARITEAFDAYRLILQEWSAT